LSFRRPWLQHTFRAKAVRHQLTKLTRGVRSASLGLRHIAQKAAQRRVSKTLYEIAPPYFWGRRPSWPAKESYGLKVLLNENMIK